MKFAVILLLLNCLSFAHAQDIIGDWWRYNNATEDHDYIFIDENLNFILRISNSEEEEVFEGSLRLILGLRYYTEVEYKDDIIFGELTYNTYGNYIHFRLFISNSYYTGFFYSDMRFPSPPAPPRDNRIGFFDFSFIPTPGMFGWQYNILSREENAGLFSIDIYSLNVVHTYSNTYLSLIPAKYFYNIGSSTHEMSFLNAEIFWDVLSLGDRRRAVYLPQEFMLGPSVSYNWLYLRDFDSFDFNKYDFRAGIKFMLLFNLALNAEAGYINSSGNNGFYLNLSLGNMVPIILPFAFWWEYL